MTPEDIAAVAARLTEAQREFALSLPADGDTKHWPRGMTQSERTGLRGFGQSGLIGGRYDLTGAYYWLTPLGMAVRQHLQERRHD